MNERMLLTIAARVVPQAAHFDLAAREAFLSPVRDFLASKPRRLRRQLGLLLSLVRWLPFLRYLRPFDALAPTQQDAVLRGFQDSSLLLFRRGFWGLKAIIFLGYYGRPEAAAAVGWRPDRDGGLRPRG